MILAEGTVQVAAVASDGENHGTRMKMIKRFFLDRIKRDARQPSVSITDNAAVYVSARAAGTVSAFLDMTMPETNITGCGHSFIITASPPVEIYAFFNTSYAAASAPSSGMTPVKC